MTGGPMVLGSGPLHRTVSRALAGERADRGTTVLVTRLDAVRDHADLIAGGGIMLVGTWRSLAYIASPWRPGLGGCPFCLVTRAANSPYGPRHHGDEIVRATGPRGAAKELPGVSPAFAGMAAEFVRWRYRGEADASTVTVLDCRTGTADEQVLLPDSLCALCAPAPAERRTALTDPAIPLRKLSPTTLRTRSLAATVTEDDYLRTGLGLFKEVKEDLQSPFGACSVDQPARWGAREPAIGRAISYRAARRIAILEGLERYAGLCRGGRPRPVRAAYADLAERAVSPADLGLHPAESYASPGFRFRPFDPETVIDWVHGYSITRDREVLVPERAVYWGPRTDGEPTFCYETSNGCALGSSVEEAALHGLRELVERDSFLLTWYRSLRLPEVSLDDLRDGDLPGDRVYDDAVADEELGLLLRKAELFTRTRIRAFLSTMEYGMPSFWLVAEGRDENGPAIVAGSGAHPDPRQALHTGLHELVGAVLHVRHYYKARLPRATAMLDDPFLVRRMEDHAAVNALPQAKGRFSFLLDGPGPALRLAEVPAMIRRDEPDLRADLAAAVSGMAAAGLEVIVVDQTMDELARSGLRCVKVVVPGLVPMTFGHLHRRTVGLPRLTGGAALPYRESVEPVDVDAAPPHPFP